MALQVLQFTVTVPAGTAKATPAVFPLAIDNWDVETIDLEVPPGPSGAMGFAVYNNGVQWIPRTAGTWLVWDDNSQSWDVEGQPTGSGWQIAAYNLGTYPHSITARFHVNSPATAAAATVTPTVTIITSDAPAADPVVLG